jgi:hypothetical protein
VAQACTRKPRPNSRRAVPHRNHAAQRKASRAGAGSNSTKTITFGSSTAPMPLTAATFTRRSSALPGSAAGRDRACTRGPSGAGSFRPSSRGSSRGERARRRRQAVIAGSGSGGDRPPWDGPLINTTGRHSVIHAAGHLQNGRFDPRAVAASHRVGSPARSCSGFVAGSLATGSGGSCRGCRSGVGTLGFWATKTFLLLPWTNSSADAVVPERGRGIGAEMVKVTGSARCRKSRCRGL